MWASPSAVAQIEDAKSMPAPSHKSNEWIERVRWCADEHFDTAAHSAVSGIDYKKKEAPRSPHFDM